jgi:histidinol-phosphate aminotransferase
MAFDLAARVRPGLLDIAPYVPGKPIEQVTRELGLTEVLKFASNENPLGPSLRAVEAIRRVAGEVHRYADAGAVRLRAAIAERIGVTPEHVVATAGSNEMINIAVQVFVGPGDEVIVHHPSFLMYPIAVVSFGGGVVRAEGQDLATDVDAMLAAVTPRTRLVFLANPNNPTGDLVRRREYERLVDRLPPEVVLVVDEAYHEYVEDPEYPNGIRTMLERPDRAIIVLRTFSKAHALAALRVGYGVMRPDIANVVHRIRQPFNVSAVAQEAALASLNDEEQIARARECNRRGRAQLVPGLRALGVEPREGHGNFVLARFPMEVGPLCQALERRGLIVRPLKGWGVGPEYSRITIGTEAENRRLLAALAELLAPVTGGAARQQSTPAS